MAAAGSHLLEHKVAHDGVSNAKDIVESAPTGGRTHGLLERQRRVNLAAQFVLRVVAQEPVTDEVIVIAPRLDRHDCVFHDHGKVPSHPVPEPVDVITDKALVVLLDAAIPQDNIVLHGKLRSLNPRSRDVGVLAPHVEQEGKLPARVRGAVGQAEKGACVVALDLPALLLKRVNHSTAIRPLR